MLIIFSKLKMSIRVLVLICLGQVAIATASGDTFNFTFQVTGEVETDSPLNCSYGLQFPGVFLRIEYRLITAGTAGHWNLLNTTELDPVDTIEGDSLKKVPAQSIDSNNNCLVQLRIVQPEHGGSYCNCWKASLNYTVTSGTGTSRGVLETCTASNQNQYIGCENLSTSALDLRMLKFKPIDQEGNASTNYCSEVINPSPNTTLPRLDNNCSLNEPRIVVKFLFVVPSGMSPGRFKEGIEISITDCKNEGFWVPLYFIANSNEIVKNNHTDILEGLRTIRGYEIPYRIHQPGTEADGSLLMINITLTFCGDDFVKSGFQIRWLQSAMVGGGKKFMDDMRTSILNYTLTDILYLDDLSVEYLDQNNSQVFNESLIPGNGSSSGIYQKYWRNSGVNNGRIQLGLTCDTYACGIEEQTLVSRIVKTVPINFTITSNCDTGSTNCGDVTTAPLTTSESTTEPTLSNLMQDLNSVKQEVASSSTLSSFLTIPPSEAAESLLVLLSGNSTAVPSTSITAFTFLLSDILSRAVNNGTSNGSQQLAVDLLSVGDSIISLSLDSSLTPSSSVAGSTLLTVIEQLAFSLITPDSGLLVTDNIAVSVLNVGSEEELVVQIVVNGNTIDYIEAISVDSNSIYVPAQLAVNTTLVAVHYRNITGLLPGNLPGRNDTELGSSVISASLSCDTNTSCNTSRTSLDQPIRIELLIENLTDREVDEIFCVFWKFETESDGPLTDGEWSTDGCEMSNLSNSSNVICECNHLTNFAVLLSFKPLRDPIQKFVLDVISYIGLGVSLLALLSTIFILGFLRSLQSMRNFVHINLCVSLILAHLTFAIGITPLGQDLGQEGEVSASCRTAAVFIQYFFLVSFMWMLMEGVVLYVALVKVFVRHQIRYMISFFIISYGAPLLYMVLSVVLGFVLNSGDNYGYINPPVDNTTSPTIVCWLNPKTGFLGTFVAPVVMVILVNLGFFIMAIVVMRKHKQRETDKTRKQKAKYWLRSSISLVTIMGLTWVIGIMAFEIPALFPFAYIFTIIVAFQGVAIFILFVPLSKQVRQAYLKWWRVKSAESEIIEKYFSKFSHSSNSYSSGVTMKSMVPNGKRNTINVYTNSSADSDIKNCDQITTDSLNGNHNIYSNPSASLDVKNRDQKTVDSRFIY